MSYLRIRFQVSREQSEKLGDLMQVFGALAVTLENAGEDAFYEAAHPHTPSWRQIYATGLFDSDVDGDDIVGQVTTSFGSAVHRGTTSLADQNWERAWLSGFHRFKAGPGLWVVPSWEEPADPLAINITIDPGLAFGTGTHPTTALCMDWLARQPLNGGTVIDYGCGSGILAVTALKLGVGRAWGVDVDPKAVVASMQNARRNGVGNRYVACAPKALASGLRANIVIVNILAGVIIELADKLYALMELKGTILLTGLLREQETDVIRGFPPTMEFKSHHSGQWSLLVGKHSDGMR